MIIETVEIDKLKPFERNPKVHPESQLKKLEKSISEFGWTNPILATKDGMVVAGHARLEAAKRLNIGNVPVIYLDMPYEKAIAYVIADNRLAELAETDTAQLSELLGELSAVPDFDIELTGFDVDEVASLNPAEVVEDNFDVDDALADIDEPVTKRGDIILLGKHRLMCGDSTVAGDVERLMDGKKADMVFTDPPYGINKNIINDDMEGDEFDLWNNNWVDKCVVVDDVAMVIYHSTRTFPSILNACLNNEWNFEKMFFFYRPDKMPVHTWNGWMMTSQAILLFSKGTPEYNKISPAHQDVFKVTSSGLGDDKTIHPTQKPVKHLIDMLSHFKVVIVYEPFCGSGSTLIAAEQTNHICYGCEISELYCDVIISRWEEFTNQKAIRPKT